MSFKPFAVPGINFLRPVRVLKTESFRSAALFATLFLILSWVLLGAVYWIVNETQTAALVGAVDADINTIRNGYRGKGVSEAVEVVQQRLGPRDYSGADLPGGYIQHKVRRPGSDSHSAEMGECDSKVVKPVWTVAEPQVPGPLGVVNSHGSEVPGGSARRRVCEKKLGLTGIAADPNARLRVHGIDIQSISPTGRRRPDADL